MSFQQPAGNTLFTATISDSNAAFLDGTTVPLAECASAATTLPLDLDLWHRRLAHHHFEGVKNLLKKKLVTGMTLNSSAAPDPICEPCLAGKMHANPFPSSEWRATRPLELVHSDAHQVPYPSFSGYRYWVTFIDDYSRFRFVLLIKAKSDIFDAFKQFKAYAENQSEHKIKILRDDKGGEYMSNAFTKNTTNCGIERQHTVRARPQQNGVAERANRVLSERLTTMLDKSGLAKAFWGEALGALVHTPYQLWNGTKPDVSHLRVWGCTAYVHIQKLVLVLKWRSVSLLATLRATRAGNSTTPLRRRLLSQRELTLMRDTSLCLSVLYQPLSLLRVQKLRILLLPLQQRDTRADLLPKATIRGLALTILRSLHPLSGCPPFELS